MVGLTDDCPEYPGHDCVSWVHGTWPTSDEAREHAGEVPACFRPHILPMADIPAEDAAMRDAGQL